MSKTKNQVVLASSTISWAEHLKATLSQTFDIFYPLVSRLGPVENDNETSSFYLHCNGEGALFVHAAFGSIMKLVAHDDFHRSVVFQHLPICIPFFRNQIPSRKLVAHDGDQLIATKSAIIFPVGKLQNSKQKPTKYHKANEEVSHRISVGMRQRIQPQVTRGVSGSCSSWIRPKTTKYQKYGNDCRHMRSLADLSSTFEGMTFVGEDLYNCSVKRSDE
ncbi:hypothetical protein FEM48_Zijuj08G0119200 [Ziziphus jujuba var. spinosa]|uniref:Uncharacterized protein n=1 Tax=Ziziphus jujuba var. spinosa TaxID=714518 RepID=A0A978UYY6_ZIZJJ|nr:hypothetical protein FEM48_Zijuj08G0119200 [Ziziphus jujuba var. spinosa]